MAMIQHIYVHIYIYTHIHYLHVEYADYLQVLSAYRLQEMKLKQEKREQRRGNLQGAAMLGVDGVDQDMFVMIFHMIVHDIEKLYSHNDQWYICTGSCHAVLKSLYWNT